MPPIRLAQVLAGAERGGAENFYTRLVLALGERPELEQLACLRPHAHRVAALEAGGVATAGFPFGGPLDVLGRWRYRRRLAEFRPDVVMTWMGRASVSTPAGRGRYVLVNRLGHYYDLKSYRHADYWVGITRGICRHLVDGGMPEERVFHIPNFADERPVEPVSRASCETPDGVPLVLAAGRLHVNKAFDTLLHAMAAVPGAVLWLAGTGPEEARLRALAGELGLAGRVRFLGWREDVTALMRAADVFVCPSRHEGLGSIVLESWAHRCPLIATRSQGPAELISDGRDGLLTPIDDAPTLGRVIGGLLADPTRRAALAEEGARTYAREYSRAAIAEAYVRLFSRLVPGR